MKSDISKLKAVVIGASAGGLSAFMQIVPSVKEETPYPVIIVQHMLPNEESLLPGLLRDIAKVPVIEIIDKMTIVPAKIYIAPPNYHLLIENESTFALSTDERVNFSRPSIDVTLTSAADVWGSSVAGILLTGANHDGSRGLLRISEAGGKVIIQDPEEAQYQVMPESAISLVEKCKICSLAEIGKFLAMDPAFILENLF